MDNSEPLVSVILPVYNAENYIREAAQSILDQTHKNIELIIIDDASTDRSYEVLSAISDSRIRLFRNEKNLKLIATLNKALKLCQGQYVARMDADDISEPNRIKKQVDYFARHPEIHVLGSQIVFINEAGNKIGKPRFCVQGNDKIKWRFLFGNCMNHPTVMFRKSILTKDFYYDENYPHAEDYELWLRLSRKNNFDNLNEPLLRYRLHASSVSHQHSETQVQSSCRALQQHLKMTENKEISLELLKCILFPRVKTQASLLGDILMYFSLFHPRRFKLKGALGLFHFLRCKVIGFCILRRLGL